MVISINDPEGFENPRGLKSHKLHFNTHVTHNITHTN